MPTVIDGSIGYRLLGWDDSEPQKVAIDRTVRLPIDPNSTSACVSTLDCDGDGYSDFVSSSDSGLDCTSASGDLLWHRPSTPTARLLGTFEKDGRGYLTLQTEPAEADTVFFLDARTGEKWDGFDADPMDRALNAENTKHASLIVHDYTPSSSSLTSIRRSGVRVPRTGKSPADPRYVRLLPWVVNAKFFLLSNPVTARHISWTRILKLALGVFIVPFVVVWICMRTRFTIRQLLLVASTIALALSLVLADNSAFPTDDRQLGYSYALEAAFFLAFHIFLLVLPLIELTRARWRRRLSLIVYVAFLVIVPLFGLLAYPASVIPTTYTYQAFWHLFWFALLPTGFALLVIHSFRILGKGVLRIARSKIFGNLFSKKVAQASGIQIAGDSHGG